MYVDSTSMPLCASASATRSAFVEKFARYRRIMARTVPPKHASPPAAGSVSARYSAFALTPVSEATTELAGRGLAPAATSRRSASSAGPISGSAAGAPPTTSTTSPRGARLGVARRELAALPRTISSCTFVSSRQTTTGRSGSSSASAASDAATRLGDSNATIVSGARNSAANSPRLRGR